MSSIGREVSFCEFSKAVYFYITLIYEILESVLNSINLTFLLSLIFDCMITYILQDLQYF